MHPSKSYNHTPAPDDRAEHGPSPDLTEQLEGIKAAVAEAEDICADFVIEMFLEAKRLSKKMGSHTDTPWPTNTNENP